jgi:hypothetical protein
MKTRAFEFRMIGVRGLPRVLLLGLFTALAIGIIALVVVVGMAVAVTGLVISGVAVIWYAVRRALLRGAATPMPMTHWQSEIQADPAPTIDILEAEVEVLPLEEKNPDSPEPRME